MRFVSGHRFSGSVILALHDLILHNSGSSTIPICPFAIPIPQD
jgi:hypothetical protein